MKHEADAKASPATDEVLLRELSKGRDRAKNALTVLYFRFARQFIGFLTVKGLPLDAAEDALHQTFLQVLNAAKDGRLGNIENGSAYLWRAIRNTATDFIRRNRRETLLDPNLLDGEPASKRSDSPEPLHECIAAAFTAFTQKYPERGEALFLSIVEGWSSKELAEVLGRTDGATREFLSQSRKKLRTYILEWCDDLSG